MDYQAGDAIKVKFPPSRNRDGEIRTGKVKYTSQITGNIYWYCTGSLCGFCEPDMDGGSHRIGMSGSIIVD